MVKRSGPKLIQDKSFSAKKTLTVNQAKRFACQSSEECQSLVENWDKEAPLFVPFIQLSPDNERVINANVSLKGFIYPDPVPGGKLWDMEDSILLKINSVDLSLFQFKGTLQSDLLDHSQLEYTFIKKRGGEEMDPAEIQDMGFEGFSLRAYIIPSASLVSNLLITVYPFPEDLLIETYPQAKNKKFPGISGGELDIAMGIEVATVLDKPVGSPILPAIIPGSPLSTIATIPPASEIISRLSTLLRSAIIPELRSSKSALFNRYDSIEEKGEENLKTISLEMIWPEPEPVASVSDGNMNEENPELSDEDLDEDVLDLTDDERSQGGIVNEVQADLEDLEENWASGSDHESRKEKPRGKIYEKGSGKNSGKKSRRESGRRSDSIKAAPKKRRDVSERKKSVEKKRRMKRSESEMDTNESESESGEDESNWAILSQIWPVADRPPALQIRKVVNRKSMEELTAIFKMKNEKDKLEVGGDISVDAKQPVVIFPKKSDDGQSKLHPARWLRLPTTDPGLWCDQVPLKTTPVIRNMALDYTGSQNMVPNKTVECLHDRSKPLLLKHFHPANLNVLGKGRKDIFSLEDGVLQKSQDLSWESPQSLQQLQECLINFALLNQQLHPWDPTALILLRLLVKYRWISATDDYITRRAIITSLFEAVSRNNASRACNRRPPMPFKDQEDCLKEILVKSGVSPDIPLPSIPKVSSSASQANQGGQAGRGARGGYRGQSNRGGFNGRGGGRGRGGYGSSGANRDQTGTVVDSKSLCFGYNTMDNRPCNKNKTQDGCTDGNRSFIHLCNKILPGGGYCLLKHPRSLHPN